jgi:hypothetical protein
MPDIDSLSTPRPDWSDSALAGEFARLPRIGVLESARRHWLLVLLPIVVFVAIAAAATASRSPTYTAQAQLVVGRLNISTASAVQGFTSAAESLAAVYSRTVTADGVVDPLARSYHSTAASIRGRISGTPIPASPIVEVIATGSSSNDAINLANAAAASLVSFLTSLDRNDPDAAALLTQVGAAARAYQAALAVVEREHALGPLNPNQQAAAAVLEVAKLHMDSVETDYHDSVQSQAVSSLLVPLTRAKSATSDRLSVVQIYGFAALVLGAFVGLALATLRANQIARRVLTAAPWDAGESEIDASAAAQD